MTKCDILGCEETATVRLQVKIAFRNKEDTTYRCEEHENPPTKVLNRKTIEP